MRALLSLTLLFSLSPSAMAYSPWIEAHSKCHEAFQKNLPKPSPQVTNYIFPKFRNQINKEDTLFDQTWGHIMAFPGINGDKAGLWILSKGKSYFTELPRPEVTDHLPKLMAPQNYWRFVLELEKNKAPIQVTLRRNAAPEDILSVDIHKPFGGTEEPKIRLEAKQETPADLEQQSADVMMKLINHNINNIGGVYPRGREALKTCHQALDETKSQNRPILQAMETLMSARTLKEDTRPSMYEPPLLMDRFLPEHNWNYGGGNTLR